MASTANYDHHSLPAPSHGQEQYYTPYQQQRPAQDYHNQSHPQPYQSQYQQHPQYRQESQQVQQSQFQQQAQFQQQQPQQQQRPPPLKAPEKSSQQQQQRRPKSRAFSFRSDKSHKSSNGPSYKLDLTETSAEKEAKRLHSKADPRMALNEREPAMEAQMLSSRPALRSIQHKDVNGNLIADPDRSNPTRSRWERPLDTIRSFEAAIDGGYNRKSLYKPDNESVGTWNRRSSYYANNGQRPAQDGMYGSGRPNRTDSGVFDPRQSTIGESSRDSYYDGFDGSYNNGGPGVGVRTKYSRNQSEPYYNGRGRDVYPIPNNHQSYETVASGSGTGSMGEPVGYQTDPTSSENSSINRRSPPKRQEPVNNDYGINFGQSAYHQGPNLNMNRPRGENPSPPQRTQPPMIRKPSNAAASNGISQERPGTSEKRKSWFVRRFSKNHH